MRSDRRAKRRGGSLAFVLVVATLGFLCAFVFAGSTSAHLAFSRRSSRVTRARTLADSVVTRALAELQQNVEFGQNGEALRVTLPGNPDGSAGELTFAPGATVYSTYNLDSDTSRPGYGGRLVPPHSVHVVGEGRCLDLTQRVEAIVTLPPYPYAIASSGPIESDGELLVGSLDAESAGGTIAVENLLPAHLASNDPVDSSITLGPNSTVMGDIRSVGGLRLSDGVVVKGQTLSYGEPVALPEIPLQEYDPEGRQPGYQVLPSEVTDATISGTARSEGDLTIYGELVLDEGKLYVDGHLTVRGPISGKGVVVAKEGADLYTGARLTDGHAVLLSGDDVRLRGGGPLGSFFQGLVYSEGSFQAEDITVVGSFISRGEGAGVKLSNARVLGETDYTTLEPSASVTFHFVQGERRNEPAVQVAGPTADSFSVEVTIKNSPDGPEIEVLDPIDRTSRICTSYHTAARQIAVVANKFARQLEGQGVIPGSGRNLVAAAETLEATLTRRAQELESSEAEFDLNRFLGVADRLRVTLWREL